MQNTNGSASLVTTTVEGLKRTFFTPPCAFVVACLLGPALLEHFGEPLGEPLGLAFWTAWPLMLFLFIGVCVVAYTFRGGSGYIEQLDRMDAWIAAWYFFNGMFFNSAMDVFAGQFQSWQTMTARYNELEPRYSMSSNYNGVTVLLTSAQELLIQTPCGLALFYGYWRGASWRYSLEIVFNMWSVAGVWYFYGSEFVLGFPFVHSPFNATVEADKGWYSFETCWKFYIGFVIFPGLWAVIGCYLTFRAGQEINRHVEISNVVIVQEELRDILEQSSEWGRGDEDEGVDEDKELEIEQIAGTRNTGANRKGRKGD